MVQLSDLFRNLDLPAEFYLLGQLPPTRIPWQPPDPVPANEGDPGGLWDTRVIAVMCRYLTSGYPVLVGTTDHAFVICGWERQPNSNMITFIRHDDQRGPYLPVGNVFDDIDPATGYRYGPWRTLHVPLPSKLWLPPEPAERIGGIALEAASTAVVPLLSVVGEGGAAVEDLASLIASNRLALRTYAVSSNRFKANLAERGFDEATISRYRLARFPRFVWVVEAVDRELRHRGQPAVIGEALVDPTSSEHDPQLLALRIHGALWLKPGASPPVFLGSTPVTSGGIGLM